MGYETIPVDEETKKRIIALCRAYEMSEKRGQGALVRKLVNAEYNKLAAVKLVAPVEETSNPTTQA